MDSGNGLSVVLTGVSTTAGSSDPNGGAKVSGGAFKLPAGAVVTFEVSHAVDTENFEDPPSYNEGSEGSYTFTVPSDCGEGGSGSGGPLVEVDFEPLEDPAESVSNETLTIEYEVVCCGDT